MLLKGAMNNTKKILYIITYLELGGAQKQLFSIIDGLDKNKYLVYLATSDRGHLKQKFTQLSNVKLKFVPSLVREINPILDICAFFQLYFFIRRNNFDIVHTHSPKASFLGRWAAYFAGVGNIIYTVHGWPFHKYMNKFAYGLYLFLERLTARITDKIIVVSRADLNLGIREKVAVAEKFSLVHYGIDVEKFNEVFISRNGRIIKQEHCLSTVSALKPQKNIFYFLKLCRYLVDKGFNVKFNIIGDGPLHNRIVAKINKLGLGKYVTLCGWVEDISVILKKTDIFILTSLWEGLPIAVIEAIISGVPIMVSNTPGLSDIVTKDVGEVASLEGDGFFKSCANMLNNYHYWDTIIRGNHDKVNLAYWTVERMVKQTDDVYEEILK